MSEMTYAEWQRERTTVMEEARVRADTIAALRAALAAKDAEIADLRISVIAFCGPAAAQWARERGLPPNHLNPTHYDILAKAGARMVDFVRAKEPPHAE